MIKKRKLIVSLFTMISTLPLIAVSCSANESLKKPYWEETEFESKYKDLRASFSDNTNELYKYNVNAFTLFTKIEPSEITLYKNNIKSDYDKLKDFLIQNKNMYVAPSDFLNKLELLEDWLNKIVGPDQDSYIDQITDYINQYFEWAKIRISAPN
ncbi:hypothetical protein [Mycoplasmopsis agassizii]|uniref:Variable surface lipoprotein n=1 Tax=Mycoplasmopsis agassizii TaxID=33922 RepID=A0ABX4H5Q5_9BACT|nr:hypothetical protein [Mycoplasmopsis agassizii]PAF55215.1 hypothetical protein CJF60_00820 [Mycoplasmopsis agassizii]SMC18790.1 hypothetical protein SAMN02745179_00768 [Mycoplasmopsis agassizii]